MVEVDFIRACVNYVRAGDYLFAHAGIRPGIPIEDQDGHSVAKEPETRSNRIGIDTGCYRTGRLTALVVDGPETRFLST